MIIVIVALAGGHASAVTLEDIVELSQAGIGEDVLIELIRMDDVSYPLTPSRLRALKGAGISDRILLALLRSGRPARDDRRAAAQIDDNPTTTRSAGCKPRRVACESVAPRLVPAGARAGASPPDAWHPRHAASSRATHRVWVRRGERFQCPGARDSGGQSRGRGTHTGLLGLGWQETPRLLERTQREEQVASAGCATQHLTIPHPAARGESPAAFERRYIPADGVATSVAYCRYAPSSRLVPAERGVITTALGARGTFTTDS